MAGLGAAGGVAGGADGAGAGCCLAFSWVGAGVLARRSMSGAPGVADLEDGRGGGAELLAPGGISGIVWEGLAGIAGVAGIGSAGISIWLVALGAALGTGTVGMEDVEPAGKEFGVAIAPGGSEGNFCCACDCCGAGDDVAGGGGGGGTMASCCDLAAFVWGAGVLPGAVLEFAVCTGVGLFGSKNLPTAAVKPTVSSTTAAVFIQAGGSLSRDKIPEAPVRLRLGRATISAVYSSRALAKSNSCKTPRCTTGPDSAVAREPKNKLWDSKPFGCK